MPTEPSIQNEQREFFRVNHDVLFDYKIVDADTANDADPAEVDTEGFNIQLARELRKLDREISQAFQIIAKKDALLGDALTKLNQKIDKLTQYHLSSNEQRNQEKTRINLSEGGVAFRGSRAMYKGNYLLLRLVFLPSYLPVLLFARVVRCESKDSEHHIAARFHRVSPAVQQELARQILKAQALNRKRATKEETRQNEN